MASASSVRLIRELSEASDFDIFFAPSRSDMIRVASPVIGLGQREERSEAVGADRGAEVVVEFLRDVARQFKVLPLVFADRHLVAR